MDPSLFHFSDPAWLWGLAAIPLVLATHALLHKRRPANRMLERFADKHLLPHLIKSDRGAENSGRRGLALWALAWLCGMLAMAGPQWRYTDTQVFKPAKDLVVVLDLSGSMNATDLKPSRLARAREEISDLIDMNRGLTVGLVAYADIPHMVAPLTDDMRTIKNLLPSIDTSLITIDGDRLKPALQMAARMLKAEPGRDKSILVVSDGDFSETDSADLAEAAKGAEIDTLGIGTEAGAPIPAADGGWVKDAKGDIVIDRLHARKLQALSAASNGIYVPSVYDNSDTQAILDHIGRASEDARGGGKTIRVWDEGFYLPALVLALLLLPWFRKGSLFPALILFMFLTTPAHNARAADVADWFRNPAQQGQVDFAAGRYAEAAKKFSDPYQQGVAAYKAGQFAQAAALFRSAATRKENRLAAVYNLGNAQIMQNDPEGAIKSYEAVLKKAPGDTRARHNLAIARKLLQQKKQEQKQQQSQGSQPQEGERKQNQKQDAGSETRKRQNGQKEPQQQPQQAPSAQNPKGQPGQQPQTQDRNKEPRQNSASTQPPAAAHQEPAEKKGQQQKPSSPQEMQPGNAQNQPGNKPTPPQSAGTEAPAARNDRRDDQTAAQRPRTPRDIDADRWLDHIQSDPGSFLKNQFMIEEQQGTEKQGEQP